MVDLDQGIRVSVVVRDDGSLLRRQYCWQGVDDWTGGGHKTRWEGKHFVLAEENQRDPEVTSLKVETGLVRDNSWRGESENNR